MEPLVCDLAAAAPPGCATDLAALTCLGAPVSLAALLVDMTRARVYLCALSKTVTHKIRAVTAMPLFKIDESSTLFSKLLGFDSYDSQNMLQLPPAPGATRQNLSPWIADKNSQLARTRAIEFHCPTLINSSYDLPQSTRWYKIYSAA